MARIKKEVNSKYIYSVINKIKKAINMTNEIELKLNLISVCADILYKTCLTYYDNDLENELNKISDSFSQNINENDTKSNVVFFYDGFGLDSRGLARVYIKAICKKYKVIYLVDKEWLVNIPKIEKHVLNSGGEIVLLEGNVCERIKMLVESYNKHNPKHFIFYGQPNDVVSTTFMYACPSKTISYLINLTDHAFWLGQNCADKIIEFRSFGGNVSCQYRNIPEEKIHVLPFYPIIDFDKEYEGYPDGLGEENKIEKKIIFSGGAAYKIEGGEGKYSKIVEEILEYDKETVLWYATNDKSEILDELSNKYPGRIFVTPERKDLYQVLKHCYFYLSTYPICGGLMFQYAAKAGKIPYTLKNNNLTEGFLINQKVLGIEFDAVDDLLEDIKHSLSDNNYCNEKSLKISQSVIEENEFEQNVYCLLEEGHTEVVWEKQKISVKFLQDEFINNCSIEDIEQIVAKKKVLFLLRFLPKLYIIGILKKAYAKLMEAF